MKSENKYFIYDAPVSQSFLKIIKGILKRFVMVYYSLTNLFFKQNDTRKCKYYVSVCCIFKNEAKYLQEWIEYNKIAGVDHFYLYNNNSTDSYLEVLKPYVDNGDVTLLDWPKNQAQMECYADAIERYRNETKWLGFIDVDEFIVPNNTDSIGEFLKKFESRPAVILFWKIFCSSGYVTRDSSRLVTQDFVVSWNKYCDIGKCFYNTSYDIDVNYKMNKTLHHSLWATCGGVHIPPVNEFDKICIGNNRRITSKTDPQNFPIQINHYFTKSFDEYCEKKSKGDVYYKQNPHDIDYFFYHEMKCQSSDYHAYKYLIKLKKSLNRD